MLSNAQSIDAKEENVSKLPIPSQGTEASIPESILLGRNFDRLPEEILAEILCWCCAAPSSTQQTATQAPLILSRVSRKWRRIVLQTPRLWMHLNLTFRGTDGNFLEKPFKLLKLWVTRVQNCPLIIDIVFDEHLRQRMPLNVLPYVDSVISATLELKPLLRPDKMKLCAVINAMADVHFIDDKFPRVLEQYYWAEAESRPDRPHPGTVQINVTRYASLVYALEGHAPLGPYLVHLDLRDPHDAIWFEVEEAHVVLSNFPQLEHCAIRLGYDTGPDTFDAVELPRLERLVMRWSEGVEVGRLLDALMTPVIHHLELSGPLRSRESLVDGRWGHLSSFLRRCRPPLFGLELGWMDGSVIDIISCLASCSELSHLTLTDCMLGEELVDTWRSVRHPLHNAALRTLLGVEYLGLVGCDIHDISGLLLSVCADDSLWQESHLEELFVLDCDIPDTVAREAEEHLPVEIVEISDERQDDD